jgi:hypothetical protein
MKLKLHGSQLINRNFLTTLFGYPMSARQLTVALSLLGATALLWLGVGLAPSKAQQLARGLQGEQAYEVQQQGQTVGYLHSRTEQNDQGDWVMAQRLSINLLNAPAYGSVQSLTFEAAPPHPLLDASYREERQGQYRQISLTRGDNGYRAQINRDGGTQDTAPVIEFNLADQLSLELQLSQQAQVGTSYTSRYLNLQQLSVDQREHRLTAHDGQTYTLTSAENGNVTSLDARLGLISFDAPFQFSFYRTQLPKKDLYQLTNALHQQWSDRLAVAPLTQDLETPATLSTLTLTLGTTTERSLQEQGLPQTLGTRQTPSELVGKDDYLSGSLTLPVKHPRILPLFTKAPIATSQSPSQLAQSLIDQTRAQLLYSENQPAGSVLNALETGRGECVDFADLLTTLARSQGIPSRTVYGIAYSPLPSPGFRFHAWNEIWHQRAWHALDPTWDQPIADATHIALDDQTSAALASAMQRQSVTLTPTVWTYRKERSEQEKQAGG